MLGVLFIYVFIFCIGGLPWWFPGGKESACNSRDLVQYLGREHPLQKRTATYSSILAWRIPWTEETDRLQSKGLQRVRHYRVTFTYI